MSIKLSILKTMEDVLAPIGVVLGGIVIGSIVAIKKFFNEPKNEHSSGKVHTECLRRFTEHENAIKDVRNDIRQGFVDINSRFDHLYNTLLKNK